MSKITAIAKYIKQIYKPTEISVEIKDMHDKKPEYIIFTYFDNIDDRYITNPMARDIFGNKENNLQREIRSDVEKMFSIKTSGLDLNGFAPYKRHGLTINVVMNRSSE
jgi:hypothetical protein